MNFIDTLIHSVTLKDTWFGFSKSENISSFCVTGRKSLIDVLLKISLRI